jgi:hypothetical protein
MESPALSLTWRQWIVYALLAAFGATATKLFDFIRGRNRDKADIHKTRSEANELDLKTEISAAQMLRGMNLDIIKLERDKAQLKQENEAYETQLRRTKALLKLHDIRYDD